MPNISEFMAHLSIVTVAESSPVKQRGGIVSFFQIGIVSGFSLPLLTQLMCENWLLTFSLGATPALLMLCVLASWQRFHRFKPIDVAEELEAGLEVSESGSEIALSFKEGVALAVVLACMNNSTDAIIFYGPTILSAAGFGNSSSLMTAFLMALFNLPMVALMLGKYASQLLSNLLQNMQFLYLGFLGVRIILLVSRLSFRVTS